MLTVYASSVMGGPEPRPRWHRQLARRVMGMTLPRRVFMSRGPTTAQSVCLTFDDGPHPVHTPRILDVLKENAVRATFFVVGERVQSAPEIIIRILGEGHALGHHSYLHRVPVETSAGELQDEIRQTQRALVQIANCHSRLFRPPHGKLTLAKLLRVVCAGQSVVLWNRDPKDFSLASATQLINWFKSTPIVGGDVLLLHDNLAHTAEALPDLIAILRSRGLGCETVEAWVGRSATVAAADGQPGKGRP